MTPWEVLGIAPDATLPVIRQAYAARIREFRPDTHPEEFSRIRVAYEQMKTLRSRDAPRRAPEENDSPNGAPVSSDATALPPGSRDEREVTITDPMATPEGDDLAERLKLPPGRRSTVPRALLALPPYPMPLPTLDPKPAAVDPPPLVRPSAQPRPPTLVRPPASPQPPTLVRTTTAPQTPTLAPPVPVPPLTLPDPARVAVDQVRAMFAAFRQAGEQAGTSAFKTLIRTWDQYPIEVFLALESAILDGLGRQPELALVRLADRTFHWTAAGRGRQPQSPSHRITCLVELARLEETCMTGSRSQRALFGASRLPLIGWGPERSGAIAAGQRWLVLCRQAGAPELELRINRPALERLIGRQFWSTDLWWSAFLLWIGYWSLLPAWETDRIAPAVSSLLAWWCGLMLACPLARQLVHDSADLRSVLPVAGAVAFPQRRRAAVALAGLALAALGGWFVLVIVAARMGFSLFRFLPRRGSRAGPQGVVAILALFPMTLWLAFRRLEEGHGAR